MHYIITALGCKVNQYEAQAIETLLHPHGFTAAGEGDPVDLIVVNTCAVTAEGGRKSRQMIRKLREEHPQALCAVCGCWSQLSPEDAAAIGADVVHGSGSKQAFVDDILRALREHTPVACVDNPFRRFDFEPLPAGAAYGRTRAMLKIQDGCNNFCTYCVIPYTRGRIRSLPPDEMARQAAHLAEEGYRELVLTGIEIASYGRDLPGALTLADAVETVAAAAPQMRLRLGSIEPTVITEDFCRRAAATGQVCRHFHLSLQSGCDRTLARMNRKYTTAEFLACVERLRRYFPGCALTADMITGFPGETEDDQAQAVAFLEQVGFAAVHVFPYSRRPGTKADAMPEQLSHAVKSARAHAAQRVADDCKQRYLAQQIGQILPVLFETEQDGRWVGHSDNYCLVSVAGDDLRGVVKNVKISAISGQMLVGDLV